jgi:hypothetical protein
LNGNTYDNIVWLEFVRLAPESLWTEFAIYERPVEAFDGLDEDLRANLNTTHFVKCVAAMHLGVLLDFSMPPTHDLGVEIAIVLSRDGVGIGLSTDLDTLVIGEVDAFYKGVGV